MAKFDIETLRRTPAYPFVEAAHYLNVPTSTLRAWFLGQQRFKRIIALDGKPTQGLSFLNLVEAHVLVAIRRVHRVPLPKVRRALEFVSRELNIQRPLAQAEFQTNGVDLFVEELKRLINVSSDGQLEIASMLREHLRRVKRGADGLPIKLYPFTRREVGRGAPDPIEIDPRVAFGRPVLKGRGVPTSVLADRFKAGDSLQALARDFDTSAEVVEEAIRCEFDRRAAA